MKSFEHIFKCGSVYGQASSTSTPFVVTKFADIVDKIVPFFTQYPLLSSKSLNYADWCKTVYLMQNNSHLTAEGLAQIQSIKSGMNRGREANK